MSVNPNQTSDLANIAVVGLGLVGMRHVSAIAKCGHARVSAVVEPRTHGKEFARQQRIPHFETIDDLIATTRPEGIVLATPTPVHFEGALASISAGVPVLVEKPIAETSQRGQAIVEAAEDNGVPVLVGHHRRHNALVRVAKQAIDEGKIGEIRAIHAFCWLYKPDHYFAEATWRTKVGAGPVSVNLVHDIDLLRYFCGAIVEVRAQAVQSRRGFENEDLAAVLLRFQSGALGTITISDSIVSPWSWETTSGEYPVYPKLPQSCYQIGGSHGALSLPDLRIWTHENGGQDWWTPMSATRIPHEANDPLVAQMTHFADVVAGKATPLVSAREGFRSLQVVEAILQSAAEERALSP